tara:strand:- start:43 stop:318 length:276 start_codon:yes stop_codon:yes gene_type:complete
MRKLTADEIIGGLVTAYEKLLILATDPEEGSPAEYHQALGEVTALRWVLGQEKCSIDGTMPVIKVFKHDHRFVPIEDKPIMRDTFVSEDDE